MCVSVLSWFWIEIMNLIRNSNFHDTQPMTDWCIGRYWFTDVTPFPFQSDFTKWILRKDFAVVTLRVTQIPLNPFNSTTIPLQTFPSKVSSITHLQGYNSQRQRPITQLWKMGHFCVISMNRIRWGQWGGRKWAGHDALFFWVRQRQHVWRGVVWLWKNGTCETEWEGNGAQISAWRGAEGGRTDIWEYTKIHWRQHGHKTTAAGLKWSVLSWCCRSGSCRWIAPPSGFVFFWGETEALSFEWFGVCNRWDTQGKVLKESSAPFFFSSPLAALHV